jgi:hypothetical protein
MTASTGRTECGSHNPAAKYLSSETSSEIDRSRMSPEAVPIRWPAPVRSLRFYSARADNMLALWGGPAADLPGAKQKSRPVLSNLEADDSPKEVGNLLVVPHAVLIV